MYEHKIYMPTIFAKWLKNWRMVIPIKLKSDLFSIHYALFQFAVNWKFCVQFYLFFFCQAIAKHCQFSLTEVTLIRKIFKSF